MIWLKKKVLNIIKKYILKHTKWLLFFLLGTIELYKYIDTKHEKLKLQSKIETEEG